MRSFVALFVIGIKIFKFHLIIYLRKEGRKEGRKKIMRDEKKEKTKEGKTKIMRD